MDDEQKRCLIENLSPLIQDDFHKIGFHSNDGFRYFRAIGDIVHYMLFSVQEMRIGDSGVRSNGNHLLFNFGEFWIYKPGLHLEPCTLPFRSARQTETDAMVFKNRRHFKKVAEKVVKAINKIDVDRFSKVSTVQGYENYHLRGPTSLEKLYFLAHHGRLVELDAWLHLLTHPLRAVRCTKSYEEDKVLNVYIDELTVEERAFINSDHQGRLAQITKSRLSNTQTYGLGFLYEDL